MALLSRQMKAAYFILELNGFPVRVIEPIAIHKYVVYEMRIETPIQKKTRLT